MVANALSGVAASSGLGTSKAARPLAARSHPHSHSHSQQRQRLACVAAKAAKRDAEADGKGFGGLLQKLAPTAAALAMLLSPLPQADVLDGGLALSRGSNAALAGLPSSNPTKDGRAILRNALPINNKSPIRQVQKAMEQISEALRVPGVKFSEVERSIRKSQGVLKDDKKRAAILADIPNPQRRGDASAKIDQIKQMLSDFEVIAEKKDKQQVPILQQDILKLVGEIEEDMVPGFPYDVPADYSNLPQLKGRATLELKMKLKDPAKRSLDYDNFTMTMVVDGYNAPVTAGNFVDLVKRKFYDGMEIQRSDGFVVQTGDPSGPSEGFIDPGTGEIRRIPFEVMVDKETVPTYEETLEDLGRPNDQPRLPFNAYGTMAMARSEFEPNSGSSQFFFLLRDSELTPTGSNLLDGRYAVFGYVTEGKDFLESLKVGDVIESVRVLGGDENLIRKADPPPPPPPPPAPAATEAAPAEEA